MTMNKRKALGLKKKYKIYKKKIEKLQEDDDGSITSDDVDELEMETLGTIVNDEYIIIKYIGRGTFSRVWLSFHIKTSEYYVLKIYFSDAENEFKKEKAILSKTTSNNMKYNIGFINSFSCSFDKNSSSYVIVLPYLGLTLSDLCDETDRKYTLKEVKCIVNAILNSVSELHSHNILHSDLKMDNFISDHYTNDSLDFIEWFNSLDITNKYNEITTSNTPDNFNEYNKNKKKQVKRKIKTRSIKELTRKVQELLRLYNDSNDELPQEPINNQNNDESNKDNTETSNNETENETENETSNNETSQNDDINIPELNWYLVDFSNSILESEIDLDEEYQIRAYRSPENILASGYSYKSEVWAIGCIIWQLLTGDYIFEPELTGDALSRDREQLSIMQKYLGKMNTDISLQSPRTFELFEDTGKVKGYKKVKREYLNDVLTEKRPDLSDLEIDKVCNYLQNLWNYNIEKRFSIKECINHEFLIT